MAKKMSREEAEKKLDSIRYDRQFFSVGAKEPLYDPNTNARITEGMRRQERAAGDRLRELRTSDPTPRQAHAQGRYDPQRSGVSSGDTVTGMLQSSHDMNSDVPHPMTKKGTMH